MTSTHPLTTGKIGRFYLPLLLNVQLMSVSHTIINGALARQGNPVIELAAFGVAVALHLFIAAVAFQNHTLVLARGNSRCGFLMVSSYSLGLAGLVTLVLVALGYSSVGDWVLNSLLGVTGEIARQAKAALRVLAFLPFFTGIRGLAQGLLIRAHRTDLVSLSTLIRIGALLISLPLGTRWFQGAALGAFSLWCCITVETVFAIGFAWRCHRPWEEKEPSDSFLEICRFALPLSIASSLQLTLPLLVSAIISRLPDGEIALAGFGVIRGFLFLLAGPQRNLQQAYLALVHSKEDNRTLWRFNLKAGSSLALLMLLIAIPFNSLVLGQWMGVTVELRTTMTLPMIIAGLFPLGVGVVYQWAGQFTRGGQTGLIGRVVLVKILYLSAWWGLLNLLNWPPLPLSGTLVAILLFLSAQWIEILYLGAENRKAAY